MKLILAIILSLFVSVIFAETRCNCSITKGSCVATTEQNNNYIYLTSNTVACSQVIWYTDGYPKVSIVTDGISKEEWLGRSSPSLRVESCSICKDNRQNLSSANSCDTARSEYDDFVDIINSINNRLASKFDACKEKYGVLMIMGSPNNEELANMQASRNCYDSASNEHKRDRAELAKRTDDWISRNRICFDLIKAENKKNRK
ncbi:MAG: hypothetical protein JAY74_05590 [Candidatus Thiodiazotropha taylori]|nr:hypothetical protein [Candidatus Thiodiazotropha taylori]